MRRIVKLFKNHSVTVTGEKGSGKDMLFANVICRRKEPYISNMSYDDSSNFNSLDFKALDTHTSLYQLVNGKVLKYIFPYPEGADIYISDVGIYLPSQYCNELNRYYPFLPQFFALSRQLGKGTKIHVNVQSLSRAWDKIREQSEVYIRCNWCRVFGKLVIQQVTLYDKYQSCLDRVNPCRVSPSFNPFKNDDAIRIYRDQFFNSHGTVKRFILIYFNKSSYNTYYFYDLFKNGVDGDEKN